MAEAGFRTFHPPALRSLQGLIPWQECLLSVDPRSGYWVRLNPRTEDVRILNPDTTHYLQDIGGWSWDGQALWFTDREQVYVSQVQRAGEVWQLAEPVLVLTLDDRAEGIAKRGEWLYISSQGRGCIWVIRLGDGKVIQSWPTPGAGVAQLTFIADTLWLCDDIEQTLYQLDPQTGQVQLSVLTPYEHPVGVALWQGRYYVAYAGEEPYIRDEPNASQPLQLGFRDRVLIHPLVFRYYPEGQYTLSNGYVLELSYVEEWSPLEAVQLSQVEWRIALPATTDRQRVRRVEPVGMPFTVDWEQGQPVAVFRFDRLQHRQAFLFGWRAELEVFSIKYQIAPGAGTVPPLPPELQQQYLIDDDELSMDQPVIQEAAREAVADARTFPEKLLAIRNYVYDRMRYHMKSTIDPPHIALERGTGSCGEYVGIMLALLRLNGIACRTAGRYKCPKTPEFKQVPLLPQFNHVWLEVYWPGRGWLPIESNTDHLPDRPWLQPQRFFLGLAWFHLELGRGIRFERLRLPDGSRPEVGLGDLAINHICCILHEEIAPPTPPDK
ncbi:MAG: transglutaminase family protein [Gloeomargarita sp. DG_2_bins_126]